MIAGLALALLAILLSVLANDWIAGIAIAILAAAWFALRSPGRPPILALAFTFQWVQVTAGIFYVALTGRELPAMYLSEYRPMVMIGLGCLVVLVVGLRLGQSLVTSADDALSDAQSHTALPWSLLVVSYLGLTAATGAIQEFAWEVPALTQAILALTLARLALLFVMMRRLIRPRLRWGWIAVIVLGETLLGFTGYFAGFREPLMLAVVAILEVFDSRQVRHWIALSALVIIMGAAGTTWMAVRGEYRRNLEDEVSASRADRLQSIMSLSSAWLQTDVDGFFDTMDAFVDRLWAIYYPALAVARVPNLVPHEDGRILLDAIVHIFTPRALFPDKGILRSDSDMVRYYSGVRVAGMEEGTSIAFGYAAESYVDFGIPWMFLPVLAYGVLLGAVYRWLSKTVRNGELSVAIVTVVLWQALYSFERSWARHLGLFFTLFLVLGGVAILLDRMVLEPYRVSEGRRQARRVEATTTAVDV